MKLFLAEPFCNKYISKESIPIRTISEPDCGYFYLNDYLEAVFVKKLVSDIISPVLQCKGLKKNGQQVNVELSLRQEFYETPYHILQKLAEKNLVDQLKVDVIYASSAFTLSIAIGNMLTDDKDVSSMLWQLFGRRIELWGFRECFEFYQEHLFEQYPELKKLNPEKLKDKFGSDPKVNALRAAEFITTESKRLSLPQVYKLRKLDQTETVDFDPYKSFKMELLKGISK